VKGQSLPTRSASVSHHVGKDLKADVTGKGTERQTGYTFSRIVRAFHCRPDPRHR